MRRLVSQLVVAVLVFGAGWLVGSNSTSQRGDLFRLSVNAPTGDTTIKCEGCQFLSWAREGRLSERLPVLNFTCTDGPCLKVVGAIAVAPKPKLMTLR